MDPNPDSTPGDHTTYTSFPSLLNTLTSYYDYVHLSSFPLFARLPPELRAEIYTHYFHLECDSRHWKGRRWPNPHFTFQHSRYTREELLERRDRVLRPQPAPQQQQEQQDQQQQKEGQEKKQERGPQSRASNPQAIAAPEEPKQWTPIIPFFPPLCLTGGPLGKEATQYLLQTSTLELRESIAVELLDHLFSNFSTYAPPSPSPSDAHSVPRGGHLFAHLRHLFLSPQMSISTPHVQYAKRVLEAASADAQAQAQADAQADGKPTPSILPELNIPGYVVRICSTMRAFVGKCPELTRLTIQPILRVRLSDDIGADILTLALETIGAELGREFVAMFEGTSRVLKVEVEFGWGAPRRTKWHRKITRMENV